MRISILCIDIWVVLPYSLLATSMLRGFRLSRVDRGCGGVVTGVYLVIAERWKKHAEVGL